MSLSAQIQQIERENERLREELRIAKTLAQVRLSELRRLQRSTKFVDACPRADRDALRRALTDVTEETGVAAEMIMSMVRRQHACLARRLVWKRLRDGGLTLQRIADLFDCDHTTVLHGLRVLEA